MDDSTALGDAVLVLSTDSKGLIDGINRARSETEGLNEDFEHVNKNLKDQFSQKFEHVGVHLFGMDMLRTIGISEGARPILSALQLSVNAVAGAFGLATGPAGLLVFTLGALAAIGYKVYEGHAKQAEKLEELNKKSLDALTKTNELRQKLEDYEKVIIRLPPKLENLKKATEELSKAQSGGTILSETKSIELARERGRVADEQRQKYERLTKEFLGYAAAAEAGSIVQQKNTRAANDYIMKAKEQAEIAATQKGLVAELTANIDAQAHGSSNAAEALEKQTKAAKKATEANHQLNAVFDEQQKGLLGAAAEFTEYTQKMDDKIASLRAEQDVSELGQIKKHYGDVRAEIDRTYDHEADKLEKAGLDQETFSVQSLGMWRQREQAMSAVSAAEEAKREGYYKKFFGAVSNGDQMMLNAVKSTVDAMSSKWAGGIAAMIVDGETFKENFVDIMKDVARQFIQAVVEMEIRWLAFQAIMAMSGGGGSGIPLAMPGGWAARAGGGDVDAGHPYVVGERGPELFVPNAGGTIVPNDKMGGGSGDVHIEQNFNVTGMDMGSTEQARKFLRTAAAAMRRGAVEALQFARATDDQTKLQPRRAY